MRGIRAVPVLVLTIALAVSTVATPGRATAAGSWIWPVTGPVVRAFDPPDSPYGAGHRGIDIAAAIGTPVAAPAAGTVTFAGAVAGHRFVTLDHGGGLESTYSWVGTVLVGEGDRVTRGQIVATTGPGHPGGEPGSMPHLHMGVKLDDAYVDPLDYLLPLSVSGFIRLVA